MQAHEHDRLFAVAPSHLYLVAHYDWRSGWSLSVSVAGSTSAGPSRAFYEGLSTSELLDVGCSEMARALAVDTPPL